MEAVQAAQATGQRWAPRLGRMLVFTALMMVAPNAVNLAPGVVRPSTPTMLASLALMAVFAVFAHRDYVAARNAIKADPSLRGGWLVENAWWIVYLVLIVPVVVGFALVLWLMPRLA